MFRFTEWGKTQGSGEKPLSEYITQMYKAQLTRYQDQERNPPTKLIILYYLPIILNLLLFISQLDYKIQFSK